MNLISHRGNIHGPSLERENSPSYIDEAILMGYDVEIDIRYTDDFFWLGHDRAQYSIDIDWLNQRKNKLWVHCKNIKSLLVLQQSDLNFFWHENDTLTLTSKGIIWAFPGNQPIKNSIAVLPEIYEDDISESLGICTDFIKKYEALTFKQEKDDKTYYI
jgi:hypothetical protein